MVDVLNDITRYGHISFYSVPMPCHACGVNTIAEGGGNRDINTHSHHLHSVAACLAPDWSAVYLQIVPFIQCFSQYPFLQ